MLSTCNTKCTQRNIDMVLKEKHVDLTFSANFELFHIAFHESSTK